MNNKKFILVLILLFLTTWFVIVIAPDLIIKEGSKFIVTTTEKTEFETGNALFCAQLSFKIENIICIGNQLKSLDFNSLSNININSIKFGLIREDETSYIVSQTQIKALEYRKLTVDDTGEDTIKSLIVTPIIASSGNNEIECVYTREEILDPCRV